MLVPTPCVYICLIAPTLTGAQFQDAAAEGLLGLAGGMPWGDQAIQWTDRDGTKSPVAELARVLKWDGSTDGSELTAPTWAETSFKAGRLTSDWAMRGWDLITKGQDHREFILQNIQGIRPSRYFQHFRGTFMGQQYDCSYPPPREFSNHWPCDRVSTGQSPEDWAWEKIQADLKSGAVRRVASKPRVVLPLSVEPSKPRLITDARYINLWTGLADFRLDTVGQIPGVFRADSYFCNYDHKSGYHHFDFVGDEQELFGFSIRGEYFVFASGCFGYSRMPEIYHITHMALLSFVQKSFSVPCLGYLDDSLTGSLFDDRTDDLWRRGSARYAVMILAWVNFLTGYSISVRKSELQPTKVITWLGIVVDAAQNRFFIPADKRANLLSLIGVALDTKKMSIQQLESIAGKCMSLRLAVGEAAHVYTRAMFDTLVRVHQGRLWGHRFVGKSFPFDISGMCRLIRALEIWQSFIRLFEGAPWMQSFHTEIRVQTDASGRRYGGVLKAPDGTTVLEVGQEFGHDELPLDIETKEAMGVVRTLLGIAEVKGWRYLQGARLNFWVDNQPLVFCMQKGASKNPHTHAQLELLFWLKLRYHFTTTAIWWDTKANFESDRITRVDKADDWHLQTFAFRELWHRWGPVRMDLMASTVNGQTNLQGVRLPFFSRFHCPGSSGIDLLAQHVPPGLHFLFPHSRMVRAAVQHVGMMKHVRLILVTRAEEVGWMPRARGRILDDVDLPNNAVVTLEGKPVCLSFKAFLVCFEYSSYQSVDVGGERARAARAGAQYDLHSGPREGTASGQASEWPRPDSKAKL